MALISGVQPGNFGTSLPSDVYYGRCTLKVVYGTFDTSDDPDSFPEIRIPTSATLTVAPNFNGTGKATDGTLISFSSQTFTSSDGTFDFYCIDGNSPGVNPSGWNWTAVLNTEMGSTSIVFQPNKDTTLNLGYLVPLQTASGTAIVQGPAGPSPVITWDGTVIVVDGVAGPDLQGPPGSGTVTSSNITDATTVGRTLLTAADANTARSAIGAGVSNLALGTTAGTALAGNTAIPSTPGDIGAATAAQGAKADSAVQPGSLATVATSGSYNDLTNKPSGSYRWSPQVGSYWGITRSNNASTKFTVATEFAIGINLPDLTIDKVIIYVSAAGAAGSTMLIGLRPITGNPSSYGAPLFTAAFSTATASSQPVVTLVPPVAITAGPYALTWCQSIDSAATATVQYTPVELNLNGFPLAQSTQIIATGHGPAVARLNTGVTSATTLPTSVTIANDNSNQLNNSVPQVVVHRSS